jgi:phosphatidylserine synthase
MTQLWAVVLANTVTLLGFCCGVISLYATFSGTGRAWGGSSARWVLRGTLFDFVDGTVARRFDGATSFGRRFDEVTDLLSTDYVYCVSCGAKRHRHCRGLAD